MPFVKSRVNNLLVAIPNDVRGVMHRFAISGGGNELVFEPIKKSDFQRSQRQDTAPMAIGGAQNAPEPMERVELSTNVIDDDADASGPTVVDTPDEDDDIMVSADNSDGPKGPEAAPVQKPKPAAKKVASRASRRKRAVAIADIPEAQEASAAEPELY